MARLQTAEKNVKEENNRINKKIDKMCESEEETKNITNTKKVKPLGAPPNKRSLSLSPLCENVFRNFSDFDK